VATGGQHRPLEQEPDGEAYQEHKQLYAAAARFYAEALEAEPRLARDPSNGHHYNAACAATLAGCGQGKDAEPLDDK
jgi:hypothetical protein